jgi:hypothetical protein
VCSAAALVASAAAVTPLRASPPVRDEPRSIVAAFSQRSYAPGERAHLLIRNPPAGLRVGIFHAGFAKGRIRRDDVMTGMRVTQPRSVAAAGSHAVLRVTIGPWETGLYFARLTARGGKVGYAPLIVRPQRLGTSRVAVVLPTNTWQAYNFRDDNGDGIGDTWYADPYISSVDLTRPYLNRGVPPHFRGYDAGFLRWLAERGKRPDFLADDDLERIRSGALLARDYDLVVFSGHDEYVTPHAYAVIRRYKRLGGNLAFLSSDNFFYRVVRRGQTLFRTGRWRDLGRWTAPLMGVEYVGWNGNRYPNRPYVVRGARSAPWFFAGTSLGNGDRFGSYGIEIDQRTRRSPPNTIVLARIANEFGPGRSAEMTYYQTRTGAKVFSAGTINFGGSTQWPVAGRLLDNVWARLSRP